MIIENNNIYIITIAGIVAHTTNSFTEAKAWLRSYNSGE